MENIIQESLSTPVAGKYDVIVCGGGPAGVGAAVTAGREGRKVLLIDQNGYLGGMWTAGLVNPLFDHSNKTGLVKELVSRLRDLHAFGAFFDMCFDYETMKVLLDEMCEEAGVEVLFHTYVSGVTKQENTVTGVIVENKSGRQTYLASCVIDATGDGDICARAGAAYLYGSEKQHDVQSMTLMFLLGNVSYWQNRPQELVSLMQKAIEEHSLDYQVNFNAPYLIRLPLGHYAVVQLTHLNGYSGIDAVSLSKAEIQGRKMVQDTMRLFRQIPELMDVELVATAPMVGVRESRRILGDYYLTRKDAVEGRHFPDGITTVSFGIDIHDPNSPIQKCIPIKPYQIPYRSLIPKGLDGLLMAGRCISGDHEVMASYRVTGDCMAMGEAAGMAAALSQKLRTDLRSLPPEALVSALSSR